MGGRMQRISAFGAPQSSRQKNKCAAWIQRTVGPAQNAVAQRRR